MLLSHNCKKLIVENNLMYEVRGFWDVLIGELISSDNHHIIHKKNNLLKKYLQNIMCYVILCSKLFLHNKK